MVIDKSYVPFGSWDKINFSESCHLRRNFKSMCENALVPWTYNNPRVDRSTLTRQTITCCGQNIVVFQDTDADIDVFSNTAFKLWDGAFLLARHLENPLYFPQPFWEDKRCIELGSGCALVGLVAWLLGSQVTVTDLAECIPHVQRCVYHNVDSISQGTPENSCSKDKITAIAYRWGEPTAHLDQPYDVILASDVVYHPTLVPLLVDSIEQLSGPQTVTLLSYKPRGLGEEVFFDLMAKKQFTVTEIPSEHHPAQFYGSDYRLYHICR